MLISISISKIGLVIQLMLYIQRASSVTALVENGTGKLPLDCRNLPLYNSKLPLCDQRIVYSFERYFRSSPFLSLALNPRLQTIQSYRLARPSYRARASIDRVANIQHAFRPTIRWLYTLYSKYSGFYINFTTIINLEGLY